MDWTPRQVETLKEMWTLGSSASEIARELGNGVSRSAVLGKAHRLKLQVRRQPSEPRPRFVPPPRLPKRALPPPQMATQTRVVESIEELSATATIETLGAHMCRWPIGDLQNDSYSYCGRPAQKSYCDHHRQISYQPAAVRARKPDRSMERIALRYN